MKTISLELSKRLITYLEGVETECCYKDTIMYSWEEYRRDIDNLTSFKKEIKTLTLEEAIDFLPSEVSTTYINNKKETYMFKIDKIGSDYNIYYLHINGNNVFADFRGDTLLEAIEKMITYLLYNNLLGNKN